MSGEQNGSKRYITKPIAIMATIGVLVGALTALNTFTGLNFRPAWGYEIEQTTIHADETRAMLTTVMERQEEMNSILTDLHAEETRAMLTTFMEQQEEMNNNILDLQQVQYELQIGMIVREKWELRRELSDHKRTTKSYRRNSASVPEWLQIMVIETEMQIKKLDEQRRKIERKLEDHVSQLEKPTS